MNVIDASNARPVYLSSGSGQVFGMFHAGAAGAPQGTAVLICSPWGWDETASYRGRRSWAQRLAAAGHPTLRIDFPGCGDSSGRPVDPGLIESWIATVGDAADWLRENGGRSRVTVLGLGLGGLIAMAALERGAAIEELVLWGAPARGRRLLREVESFARMQDWGVGRGEELDLPEGWLEAGGFVMSAETVTTLKAMAPLETVPGGLRRALLLDRDGMAVDAGLKTRLEEAQVEVTEAAGPGWGKMVFHPEHAVLPEETIDRVGAWLDAAGEAPVGNASGEASIESPSQLEFELDGLAGRETPISIELGFGNCFAVVSEPEGERTTDLCAVYLNAGAVRHIGPNRNWVESARRWAARGMPTVRVDLEGIGESDGDRSRHPGIGGFYDETYGDQIKAVLDALEARGLGSRFICLGLCSGAYWSIHLADRDPRVEAGVALNAGAMIWRPELRTERQSRQLSGAILSLGSWKRLLRLEADFRGKAKTLAKLAALKARRLRRRILSLFGGADDAGPSEHEIEALFDRLRASDRRVAMAFCSNEPVLVELENEGITGQMSRWPNIELVPLPGEDHGLGPIGAQRSAAELIDREFERALGGSLADPDLQCR